MAGIGMGSSPRARGARRLQGWCSGDHGIIPACAGSTAECGASGIKPGDHPRVRGEHGIPTLGHLISVGSSPRARGAQAWQRGDLAELGIIPACAGSTRDRTCAHTRCGDHPRVRGEHLVWEPVDQCASGSSPRARGAHCLRSRLGILRGIIPACAGSTSQNRHSAPESGDHPRVRGEHYTEIRDDYNRKGSSPRARGALGQPLLYSCGGGIIPACAGSTGSCHQTLTLPKDHPRVRGEHSLYGRGSLLALGSSPRARGAPLV